MSVPQQRHVQTVPGILNTADTDPKAGKGDTKSSGQRGPQDTVIDVRKTTVVPSQQKLHAMWLKESGLPDPKSFEKGIDYQAVWGLDEIDQSRLDPKFLQSVYESDPVKLRERVGYLTLAGKRLKERFTTDKMRVNQEITHLKLYGSNNNDLLRHINHNIELLDSAFDGSMKSLVQLRRGKLLKNLHLHQDGQGSRVEDSDNLKSVGATDDNASSLSRLGSRDGLMSTRRTSGFGYMGSGRSLGFKDIATARKSVFNEQYIKKVAADGQVLNLQTVETGLAKAEPGLSLAELKNRAKMAAMQNQAPSPTAGSPVAQPGVETLRNLAVKIRESKSVSKDDTDVFGPMNEWYERALQKTSSLNSKDEEIFLKFGRNLYINGQTSNKLAGMDMEKIPFVHSLLLKKNEKFKKFQQEIGGLLTRLGPIKPKPKSLGSHKRWHSHDRADSPSITRDSSVDKPNAIFPRPARVAEDYKPKSSRASLAGSRIDLQDQAPLTTRNQDLKRKALQLNVLHMQNPSNVIDAMDHLGNKRLPFGDIRVKRRDVSILEASVDAANTNGDHSGKFIGRQNYRLMARHNRSNNRSLGGVLHKGYSVSNTTRESEAKTAGVSGVLPSEKENSARRVIIPKVVQSDESSRSYLRNTSKEKSSHNPLGRILKENEAVREKLSKVCQGVQSLAEKSDNHLLQESIVTVAGHIQRFKKKHTEVKYTDLIRDTIQPEPIEVMEYANRIYKNSSTEFKRRVHMVNAVSAARGGVPSYRIEKDGVAYCEE